MGHKRHKFRGSFENQAPGLTGPGITEPDYPAHMPNITTGRTVVISLDHPENNPTGVTVEEFTEEVPRDSFGINVGQQMEDLLKEHATKQAIHTTPNQKEENKMEDNKNNETKNTNGNPEQPKTEPKVDPKDTKQESKKVDPNPKQDAPKEEPKKDTPKEEQEDHPDPNKPAERDRHGSTLAREAGSAFTIGASYGMGVIVGMAAGAAIVYGVKKIFCGDGGAAAETASDTVSNLF